MANLVGWAFILWRRPFEVGDRIQIGDTAGDVIDLRIFQFTLLEIGNWVDADQSTGRVIHVNNGQVFTLSVANFSKGFEYIWNEVPVLVTFESNWEKAKGILGAIAAKHGEDLSTAAEEKLRQAARKFMIFYSKLTPTVYTSVRDCGVLLTDSVSLRPSAPAIHRTGHLGGYPPRLSPSTMTSISPTRPSASTTISMRANPERERRNKATCTNHRYWLMVG